MEITTAKVVYWLNTETGTTTYGIRVKTNGKWENLAIDGEPYFVGTWQEARDKCRNLLGLPDKTK